MRTTPTGRPPDATPDVAAAAALDFASAAETAGTPPDLWQPDLSGPDPARCNAETDPNRRRALSYGARYHGFRIRPAPFSAGEGDPKSLWGGSPTRRPSLQGVHSDLKIVFEPKAHRSCVRGVEGQATGTLIVAIPSDGPQV
jgi:hypothetical protein